MSELHFQGRPCKNGHDGLRYVGRTKPCVHCIKDSSRERSKSKHRRAQGANWAKKNRHYFTALDAVRRASQLNATPAWADQGSIKAIYKKAALLGMQVDHIVPLRSPVVCGLHVEANLQMLTKPENARKGNRHWPDMP